MASSIDAVPAEIRQAAELILGSFVWSKSPQGYEFWENVVRQLGVVAEIGDVEIGSIADQNRRAVSAGAERK